MKFAIIASDKSVASLTIKKSLIGLGFEKLNEQYQDNDVYYFDHSANKQKNIGKNPNSNQTDHDIFLYTIKESSIHFENAVEEIDADLFIFIARHVSASKEKTLCMHFTGNFGEAKYGGKENEFSMSCPHFLKIAFQNLHAIAKDSEYKVTLEATHHGPLLKKPSCFIEIGSDEDQWKDINAGDMIAKTILKTIETYSKFQNDSNTAQNDVEVALAFGGTHYCPNFNKVQLENKVALSHVCPKHGIEHLNKEILLRLVHASDKKVDYALLDWKGLTGPQKKDLATLFEQINLPYKKIKDVRE